MSGVDVLAVLDEQADFFRVRMATEREVLLMAARAVVAELMEALMMCRDSYEFVIQTNGLDPDPVIAKCDVALARCRGGAA